MDSLLAGALAGLFVDLSLFPIDTIKTRIQSKEGFLASGGFKNIYRGLSAVAVGSIPGGATFFLAYDTTRKVLFSSLGVPIEGNAAGALTGPTFAAQAVAAMVGESCACCIRVPVEMVKQQMQAGHHASMVEAARCITNQVQPVAGTSAPSFCLAGTHHLFSGMKIMLLRELPFSVIQMSLYESLKYGASHDERLQPYYGYVLPSIGAVSGGTAAFLTTPLDVIKTRIMLRKHQVATSGIRAAIAEIVDEPARANDRFGPTQKFFRGATTRVLWISLGGSIFFSTYEYTKFLFRQRGGSI